MSDFIGICPVCHANILDKDREITRLKLHIIEQATYAMEIDDLRAENDKLKAATRELITVLEAAKLRLEELMLTTGSASMNQMRDTQFIGVIDRIIAKHKPTERR